MAEVRNRIVGEGIWAHRPKHVASGCTVIPFRGYEISIALDDSHRGQNLTRATLAVFRNDEDVTADFSSIGNFTLDGMIYPTGEELFKLMQVIAEKNPL